MKIQIEVRGAEIQDHYVFDQSCIKIGRRRANDIRITDSRISGSHAEIRAHKDLADRYNFVDLHSRNGSMLSRGESSMISIAQNKCNLHSGDSGGPMACKLTSPRSLRSPKKKGKFQAPDMTSMKT